MKSRAVYLVDAGTGNIRSVARTLETLGAQVFMVKTPDEIKAGRVVLPGVGAFGEFIEGLAGRNLVDALKTAIERGDPLLGICVGMQAFFESSEEFGSYGGLGLLPGKVLKFKEESDLKIPHTGWNQLWPQNDGGPLFSGLKPGAYVYFNHSYYCQAVRADVSAFTDYAVDFASMVRRENVYGVQFHPEKSQRTGLKILANFLEL